MNNKQAFIYEINYKTADKIIDEGTGYKIE